MKQMKPSPNLLWWGRWFDITGLCVCLRCFEVLRRSRMLKESCCVCFCFVFVVRTRIKTKVLGTAVCSVVRWLGAWISVYHGHLGLEEPVCCTPAHRRDALSWCLQLSLKSLTCNGLQLDGKLSFELSFAVCVISSSSSSCSSCLNLAIWFFRKVDTVRERERDVAWDT